MRWLEGQLKVSTLNCFSLLHRACMKPHLFHTCNPMLALCGAHAYYQTWLPLLTSFNYVKWFVVRKPSNLVLGPRPASRHLRTVSDRKLG